MTAREQVEAAWKAYCAASKPTGVVHGTDVEEFDVDEMDQAAWELHQINLTLLRERDAAEALALERVKDALVAQQSRCEDNARELGGKAESRDEWHRWHGGDLSLGVAIMTVSGMHPSPNALEEHDAQVRADERKAVIDHLVIFLGWASDDGDETRERVLEEIIEDIREGKHAENMVTSAIREQAK